MTIVDYKMLEKEQKKKLLFDMGILVASRKHLVYDIELYQIGAFYVEAFYLAADPVLQYLRAFSDTDQLWPYLKQIDLSPAL